MSRTEARKAEAAAVRGRLADTVGAEMNLLARPPGNDRETALLLYIIYGRMIESLIELRAMLVEDFPGVHEASGG